MIKFVHMTLETLKEQHYSVLREIGREIGVKSPASKNKEELIESILAIQDGKLVPVPQTSRGAPPKIKIDISQFVEEIIPDEEVKKEKTTKSTKNKKKNDKEDVSFKDEPFTKLVFHDSGETPKGDVTMEGYFEPAQGGYGFLRCTKRSGAKSDAYVNSTTIKKYNLRTGDKVKGKARAVYFGDAPAIYEVELINDTNPDEYLKRIIFEDLVPYYPTRRLRLENGRNEDDISIRCIDLFAPLGMGQRGLIVSPPKAGKTTILKKIAKSIEENYKDIKLIILLIDERPEEVTDIKRSLKCEVISSTFDEGCENHIKTAEHVINRAKRLVEIGQNVVILMDSITRLARAYNTVTDSSGKTLSGGLDPNALDGPKRIFGAARNIEDGGSLTILSTALVDTGSKMDDVIYEEFKGTGNMEIFLSRELSEKRIFPAIDLYKSGTRREDLLLDEDEQKTANKLRKILSERQGATDELIEMLKKSKSNKDLITKLDGWLKAF